MNTSILNLSTLFVILNTGFCSSCKDKNEPETVCTPQNTAYFPQDAKDRFFFKEGTWWVYENSDTKETDSIWVTNASFRYWSADNMEDGNIKNKCYETGRIEIYSLYNGIKTHLVQRSFSYIGGKPGINPAQEHFTLDDAIPMFDFRPVYRFDIFGEQYQTPNQESAEITFKDSIEVNGELYNNVLHYYYPNGVSPHDYLEEAWYAKNVGTIKYISKDHSTWILVKSKIIQ